MILRRVVITFILFLICQGTFSFPVFFKCSKEGFLEESLTSKEVSDGLVLLAKSTKGSVENLIGELCQGRKECIQEFKDLIELSKISKKAAEKNFNALMQKMRSKGKITSKNRVSKATYEQYKVLTNLAYDIYMCTDEKSKLNPENFVHNNKAIIHYPFHTNYMYITGCRSNDAPECKLAMNKKRLEEGIKRALIMGVDPYTLIAINMMEMFNSNFNDGLIWDKYIPPGFWLSGAMGCPKEIPKKGVVIKKKDLSKRLGLYADNKMKSHQGYGDSIEKTAHKSYLCTNGKLKGHKNFITEIPIPGYCCLGVDRVLKKISDEELKSEKDKRMAKFKAGLARNLFRDSVVGGLMFENIRKKTSNPLNRGMRAKGGDPNEPAALIQRYQGYSSAMGGGEPVNAWRAGVNHYQDPVYGYQVMDYTVNSLMPNPLIRSMIDEKEKELGLKSKSLLCRGKDAGIYYLDSEYYKNKNRDGQRMAKLYDLKDTPWQEWPDNYQKVMLQELGDKKTNLLKGIKTNNAAEEKFLEQLSKLNYKAMTFLRKGIDLLHPKSNGVPNLMDRLVKKYFASSYEGRKTRGSVSGYTWERLNPDQIKSIGSRLGTD